VLRDAVEWVLDLYGIGDLIADPTTDQRTQDEVEEAMQELKAAYDEEEEG
jgi:L-arabinose isomerase